LPPESVVFVCPPDNLIPATIRKFVPSLDVECERYAEGAGNDLAAIGTRKGKSKVCLEKRRRKYNRATRSGTMNSGKNGG
jgi:hypothetical protein